MSQDFRPQGDQPPPSQKRGDISRNIAPGANILGISPPLPPHINFEFLSFWSKNKTLQVDKIYCVIYLF
jgi:hypothetical protein